jgi:hypothetical protein
MRVVAKARGAAAALHRLLVLLTRGANVAKLDLERLSVLVLQTAGAASRP